MRWLLAAKMPTEAARGMALKSSTWLVKVLSSSVHSSSEASLCWVPA